MTIPVIVCGLKAEIGSVVIQNLRPEYTAIRFINSVQMGVSDIPALIQGREPPSGKPAPENDLGSDDFSKPPVAILAGGGYKDNDVATMREAILKETGDVGAKIPWFRPDMNKQHPSAAAAYGNQNADRAKIRLKEVLEGGEGKDGGVFWY